MFKIFVEVVAIRRGSDQRRARRYGPCSVKRATPSLSFNYKGKVACSDYKVTITGNVPSTVDKSCLLFLGLSRERVEVFTA